MKKEILINILINFSLTIVFVMLNVWAIEQQLEETFAFFALAFGAAVTIINAMFVISLVKEKSHDSK